jgi:hypothetical protein
MKDAIVSLDLVVCTLVAYTSNNRFENHVPVGGGHQVGEIPLLMGLWETLSMFSIPVVIIPK